MGVSPAALKEFSALFVQVVKLAREAGLVSWVGWGGWDEDQGEREQAQSDELCADAGRRSSLEARDRRLAQAGRSAGRGDEDRYGRTITRWAAQDLKRVRMD